MVCMLAMLMALLFAACSTKSPLDRVGQNVSAAITILCSNTTDGKQICGCLKLMKSNHCHMCRCHIHLWKDLSVASGESYLIRLYFGLQLTWRTTCEIISATTTSVGLTLGGKVLLPQNQRAIRSSTSTTTDGKSIVAVCLNYRQRLELRFSSGTGSTARLRTT